MFCRYDMGEDKRNKYGCYTPLPRSEMLPFYLISFGEFSCDSQYFTEREGLDNYLFLGTIKGCGELTAHGKKVSLPAGSGAVIHCLPYQLYKTKEETWEFFWFHFSGTGADAMVRMMNAGGLKVFHWENRENRFEELKWYASRLGKRSDLDMSLWIHSFLCSIAVGERASQEENDREEITKAAAFIRERFWQPLSVRELAQESALSEFHFIRKFKSFVGQTPYEYLTLVRVNKAKELLALTSDSVSEVAEQVGYSDAKGLISNFKKQTGTTPAKFRQKIRSESL